MAKSAVLLLGATIYVFFTKRKARFAMMQVESIAEQLFFTTLRIETIDQNKNAGTGTGFFFSHKVGELDYQFLVTNKHVVMGMRTVSLTFHQADNQKPKPGKGFALSIEGGEPTWFGHPSPDVDIAICPFVPLAEHIRRQNKIELFYRCISSELVPSEELLGTLDAIESVTFIGYPNALWDKHNLLPIARTGTTASPLQVDFENTPRFLIDASVFGGSSGSPVLIFNQGMYTDKLGNTVIGSRVLFIGVIAGVFFRTQLNQIVAVPIPTRVQAVAEQREMLDIGIVFKARTVVDTIVAFLRRVS